MKWINRIISIGMISQLLLSCNNNSIARKPVAKFLCRIIDSSEVKKYNDTLTYFFDSVLNSKGFSGGILVAKNGQILYEHYQGFENEEKTDSITADTRFHIASTSKTFTVTAIMQLVQLGKLNLDDSLQKLFPLFPYNGITVRNLLNHSSGIPFYANFFPKYKWDKKKIATNGDILYMLYAWRPPLEFTPGSRFRYCNTNFALLALIVEKVSGQFFPDYVRDSIFNRCGMENSYVLSQNRQGDYMPSWKGGGVYNFDYLDAIYGDKNVLSTCRDLMKYDSCIRNNVLLTPSSYEQVWTPYFRDTHYRDSFEYYGLGWRLKVFNDSLKIPYHNGWWHGNNSVFQRLIADTAVIIITGNKLTNRIYAAGRAANIFRQYYSSGPTDAEALVQQEESGKNRKTKSHVHSSKKSHKKSPGKTKQSSHKKKR